MLRTLLLSSFTWPLLDTLLLAALTLTELVLPAADLTSPETNGRRNFDAILVIYSVRWDQYSKAECGGGEREFTLLKHY